MKHSKFIPIFLLAALIAGCDKSATSNDTAASEQLDKVKQDTTQAAQDMKAYTYAQKDDFVKYMQAEMDKLNKELADLSAKMDRASDSAKAEAKPKMDALKAQIAALGVDLDKAKNATESTWEDVKAGAQKALDNTKQAFKDAGDWINKQINS